MSQLRENGSTALISSASLSFGDFPNRDVAIIVTGDEVFGVRPFAGVDARDGFSVASVIRAFK